MMNHDNTKCITTKYDGKQQLLLTIISRQGKDDVYILNRNMPKELLRQALIRKGYGKTVDKILTNGIRLPKEITEFQFLEEGKITTQTEERMWSPYHKGDTVKLYPDGSFKTVKPPSRWKEFKEDIILFKNVMSVSWHLQK